MGVDVSATVRTVSLYFKTSRPYVPCIRNPDIHHNDVNKVSAPVRSATPIARRALTSCAINHAYTIHNTGPTPA